MADLFQSLLHEALGRTINPVNGAVGLLRTGNWHLCQMAVEMVLRGSALSSLLPDFSVGSVAAEGDGLGSAINSCTNWRDLEGESSSMVLKRKVISGSSIDDDLKDFEARHQRMTEKVKKHRAAMPSTEESETTTFGSGLQPGSAQRRLLRLFY